ncbi:MAG: PhzF family phenazine biosynthesis protein [Flavobacteriales bacterium]
MQKIRIYKVDAFTDRLFSGNPAAVCILDEWLRDDLLQSIASENNLAETAFILPNGSDYDIRWFTPAVEVDLCGHATLASAFVLFNLLQYPNPVIRFHSTRSGNLAVEKRDDFLFLDFPTDKLVPIDGELVHTIERCIGLKPLELYRGKTDFMAIIDSENSLQNLLPDLNEIAKLKARGLIVTAKGENVDFVSRFFAPQSGIDEDPVTGSAHTSLLPYWSGKLGKRELVASQLSVRGGQLFCEYKNERCIIGGKALLFLSGEIILD